MIRNENNLMTIKEAAEFLSVPTSRIRYMVFKKQIPFIKMASSIRFRKQNLEKWLDQKINNEANNQECNNE